MSPSSQRSRAVSLTSSSVSPREADGRDHVVPDDIKDLAEPVLSHRILLDAEAQFSGVDVQTVISRLLDSVAPPTDRVGV